VPGGGLFVRIADYASVDLVATGLDAQTKGDLLRQMVDLLVRGGRLQQSDALMEALLKREEVMSTGIGGGIALPHALSDDLGQLYVVFARTGKPIDFEALDSQPVDLVFMLVGPKASGNMYVKLLARVSRLLQSDEFKNRLRGAATPDAILEVFRAEE
jgi:fructose-specific phosphotransferase system IIA component